MLTDERSIYIGVIYKILGHPLAFGSSEIKIPSKTMNENLLKYVVV